MKRITIKILIFLLIGSFLKCAQQKTPDTKSIEKEIFAVLDQQVDAWNKCDINGYMAGYWKSDSLRFASGNKINYGWQKTLDSFKNRYNTPETIGYLTFSDVKITVLSEDAALVFGRYMLERKEDAPSGIFTLIFKKKEKGWRIVADHTSGD